MKLRSLRYHTPRLYRPLFSFCHGTGPLSLPRHHSRLGPHFHGPPQSHPFSHLVFSLPTCKCSFMPPDSPQFWPCYDSLSRPRPLSSRCPSCPPSPGTVTAPPGRVDADCRFWVSGPWSPPSLHLALLISSHITPRLNAEERSNEATNSAKRKQEQQDQERCEHGRLGATVIQC